MGVELERGGDCGEGVVKVGVSLAASHLSQEMNSVLYYIILSSRPAQAHGPRNDERHELEPVFPPLSYSDHSSENQYTGGCRLVTPPHSLIFVVMKDPGLCSTHYEKLAQHMHGSQMATSGSKFSPFTI